MVKRQPRGSKRGGQFAADRRGIVAPSAAPTRAAVQDLKTVDDLDLFKQDVSDIGFRNLGILIAERQRTLHPVSRAAQDSLLRAEVELPKLQARYEAAYKFRTGSLGYGVDGGPEVSAETLRLRLQYALVSSIPGN